MTGSATDFGGPEPEEPHEPRPTFWLRVDDVMSCIAGAYEQHLGRQATFAEVKGRYEKIAAGEDLADTIASIAASEEAQMAARTRKPPTESRESFSVALRLLYRSALGRDASGEEVSNWFGSYHSGDMDYGEVVRCICTSREAEGYKHSFALEGTSDGLFCQLVYEIVLGHGASPHDIVRWSRLLAADQTTRAKLLFDAFQQAAAARIETQVACNDTAVAWLYGRAEPMTADRWTRRLEEGPAQEPPLHARFPYEKPAGGAPLVSVITSLYRGGHYIEAFLDNIMSQSIFADCELIIVDAASPEGEHEMIEAAMRDAPNIVYQRLDTRIGIYAAWNMAVSRSKGRFLTNANLDDCRRRDSLEQQAATLLALPFVDVVHQDVVFCLEPNLPFETIAAAGFTTTFPNANAYSLLDVNSPHNAPMWRRGLHDEIGLFDESFVSAADYEFWLRCAAKGKRFYKLNDPHVGYFYNPKGISTRADTPGLSETRRITARHARALVAPELTMPANAFDERLIALGGSPGSNGDRNAAVRAALLTTAARARQLANP